MSELTVVYDEKDLFYYFQKLRLDTAKKINDEKIENSKNIKEEKATFGGVMKNIGHFFERGVMSYATIDENINQNLKDFDSKHPTVITDAHAKELIESIFQDDKYGMARLLFASTIILDDEFDYQYAPEGMEMASLLLYEDKGTLEDIKKLLFENYNAISPKSLSSVQKGILLGVAVTSFVGFMSMPLALAGAGVASVAGFGSLGVLTTESLIMSAALTGITFGGMKLYNDVKIKKEFIDLSPEKNALYLALQCTFIERIKEELDEEEFKDQLDSILRNLNTLKSDLDYYLFVEKEATKNNKAKIKSFHEFDMRLAKVLGV